MNWKKLLKYISVVLLVATPGFILPQKLVFSFGNSVNYHLFWKLGGNISFQDYVIITTPLSNKYTMGKNLIKKVGCMPGDVLEITPSRDYYCYHMGESYYLGRAKDRSLKGEPVVNFNPCGSGYCKVVVPEGEFFLIGDHKDSYDSRYMGFLNAKSILGCLKPII